MHFITGNGMQVEGSVELQHVAFAYPVRPDCLVSVLYFNVPCQSSLGQNTGMCVCLAVRPDCLVSVIKKML